MRTLKIKDKSKLFFVSDIHFGHFNMIGLANRKDDNGEPFKDADAMDEYIIEIWNEVVPKDAIVVDLGDTFFRIAKEKVRPIMKRLNFKEIHFVKGNHGLNYYKEMENLGRKVVVYDDADILHVIVDDEEFDDGKCEFMCCHYPMWEVNRAFKGALHLYGHVHRDLYFNKTSLHVGVDTWGLRPAAYQEVLTRLYIRAASEKLWK